MRAARLVVLFVVLSSASARADSGSFGLGIILGTPTGITGAVELSDHTAIDAAIGLDLFDDRDLYLHVEFDYFVPLVTGSQVSVSGYLGVGGYFVSAGDSVLGVRAPFGVSFDFSATPIQIFVEGALYLRLTQDTHLGVWPAAGFRYYF
jgi:hypothetical protein